MATYVLIHGAGSDSWYWHLVVPELRARGHEVIAPDLPSDDDTAGLPEYTDVVTEAIGDRPDLVVVAQSLGGFTAPLVCERVPVNLLILVAAMVPRPGESPGDWWANTGWQQARRAAAERDGRPLDGDFDVMTEFFHDVPANVTAEAMARGEQMQSGTPFEKPWPLGAWPDVPTKFLLCRDDRFFPADFMRRVVVSGWPSHPTRWTAVTCRRWPTRRNWPSVWRRIERRRRCDRVVVMPGTVRDEYRREVAASGLTPTAVTHLTRDALGTIDFANLAPVKTLLKRFFSAEVWTSGDDEALADLVGPGNGWWRHELDERFAFEFGWRDGAFRLELSPLEKHPSFDATFDGPVVPEATPNPHTIRFVTPVIHAGPSRWYESAIGVDDPRVARLFEFADVANVLVGPDFVAVGLRRPDQWEHLLDSVLTVVAAEFAAAAPETSPSDAAAAPRHHVSDAHSSPDVRTGALDRAWRELGALHADQPRDLDRLIAAASSTDAAERQVSARLMIGADVEIAETTWSRLLADPSRRVRRAAVDAMVDADRPALRPLLEQALRDADAWTRWKALRGLVEIGIEPSRTAVAQLADDPDFRVRLETARALGEPRG